MRLAATALSSLLRPSLQHDLVILQGLVEMALPFDQGPGQPKAARSRISGSCERTDRGSCPRHG